VLEDLPVGLYIVDQERRIRFWNRGAEHLLGHLAHDVVGHVLEGVVHSCDQQGDSLNGELCPVTMTSSRGQPQQCIAFYLHKNGHRVAVKVRTRPIVEHGDIEHGDIVGGIIVLFEEAFVYREDSSGAPMYGCLDATTGIPSPRLTRAVLNECLASLAESHVGFGVLRIRLLGLDEFRSKHGPQSVLPFLRTAAQTLRHSLDVESFLGCWGENEFLAVLPSASPVAVAATAEILRNVLAHSEVSWWGDRFLIQTEVSYAVATGEQDLEAILREMKSLSLHASETANAAAAGVSAVTANGTANVTANDTTRLRG
jgi:PAS domain S-box-containing protein